MESFDALIKIKNYRDVPSKSLEARFCETPLAHQLTEIKSANKVPHKHHLYDRNDEHFNIDHLPKMIIWLMPVVQDATMLAVHTEAVYFLRKMLLEIA